MTLITVQSRSSLIIQTVHFMTALPVSSAKSLMFWDVLVPSVQSMVFVSASSINYYPCPFGGGFKTQLYENIYVYFYRYML